jgi:hypothetical protein
VRTKDSDADCTRRRDEPLVQLRLRQSARRNGDKTRQTDEPGRGFESIIFMRRLPSRIRGVTR